MPPASGMHDCLIWCVCLCTPVYMYCENWSAQNDDSLTNIISMVSKQRVCIINTRSINTHHLTTHQNVSCIRRSHNVFVTRKFTEFIESEWRKKMCLCMYEQRRIERMKRTEKKLPNTQIIEIRADLWTLSHTRSARKYLRSRWK